MPPKKQRKPLTLFPVQRSHVERLVSILQNRNVCLDSSEVGTGKTLCAAETARRMGKRPIVIAPKAVITSWERCFDQQDLDYYDIVTWEKIKFRGGSTEWYQNGTWKVPIDSILIFDECQKAKGRGTRYSGTQNAQLIISAKRQRIPMMLLSATPFVTPVDMFALGYALDFFESVRRYRRWCLSNGCYIDFWGSLQFKYTEDGYRKLDAINHALYNEGRASRMTREDLSDFFSESEITIIPIDFDDKVSSKCNYIAKYLLKHADRLEQDEEKNSDSVLLDLLRARQEVEIYKVPVLQEYIQTFLDEGDNVVVFLNFKDTIAALSEAFSDVPHVIIDGSNSMTQRQAAIDKFQDDEARIAFVNLQAGGAGLSLHDINGNRPRVSLISLSFNLVDNVQALGRIDRAGAKTGTRQFILVTAGTIEEKIAESAKRKETSLRNIIVEK